MEECLFCKWKNEKEKIVLENDYAFARYDEFPVNKGHMLFMTKRHVKDFFETSLEEKNAIFELVEKAKEIIDNEYHPDGYNIGMNCGKAAGQSVMHFHIHVIPRYSNDDLVINPTNNMDKFNLDEIASKIRG